MIDLYNSIDYAWLKDNWYAMIQGITKVRD